jgi:hypothetical protein
MDTNDPNAEQTRLLDLAVKLGQLSLHHNRRLEHELATLRHELAGATIVAVNAARAMGLMLDRRSPSGEGVTFDYGFDPNASVVKLDDGRRQLRIQDRCYEGGYLGSGDRATVCDGAGATVFWDTIHPSSLTHCWIAYFIQDGFARAGWADAPSVEAHRQYCTEQVALNRAAGQRGSRP